MDKEIKLTNYNDEIITFKLPNFDEIKLIEIIILSGDELCRCIYPDKVIQYDSDTHFRYMNYYDGIYLLPKNKLDEFNSFIGSSYEKLEKFSKFYKTEQMRKNKKTAEQVEASSGTTSPNL